MTKEVTVAVIGLAGTVITGALAYLQFRRSQVNQRSQKERERSQAIHEKIWRLAEDISLSLRDYHPSVEEVNERVRILNTYMLTNQIFVETKINSLASEYIQSTSALAEKLSDPIYIRIWDSWRQTTILLPEDKRSAPDKELSAMVKEWDATRERFLAELRKPFKQ